MKRAQHALAQQKRKTKAEQKKRKRAELQSSVAKVNEQVQKEKAQVAVKAQLLAAKDQRLAAFTAKKMQQQAKTEVSQANKQVVRANRKVIQLEKEKEKLENAYEHLEDRYDNMRLLKNVANAQKRALQRKVDRMSQQRSKKKKAGNISDLPVAAQKTIEGYKMDAVKSMEALEEVVAEMKKEGMLSLLSVHQRGQPHSGEMLEMCMKLMSRAISAPQARDVLRDVMSSAYPSLEDKCDYQIPSVTSLQRARRILYAVANNRVLHAVNAAEEVHIMHDPAQRMASRYSRQLAAWWGLTARGWT